MNDLSSGLRSEIRKYLFGIIGLVVWPTADFTNSMALGSWASATCRCSIQIFSEFHSISICPMLM